MSRRRYLSTRVSTDALVNRLAREAGDFAALLYTWLIPHADDDGGLPDDPEEILLTVMPGRRDKEAADIAVAITAMVTLGLLQHCGGRLYFPAESFYRYQTYVSDSRRRAPESPPPPAPEPSRATNSAEQRRTPQTSARQRETAQNSASVSSSVSVSLSTADAVAGAPAREDSGGGELAMVATGTDGADLAAIRQQTGVAERLNGRARAGELHVLSAATQRRHLPRAPTNCRFMGAAALNKYELPDNIPRDFQAVVPALESRDVNRLWRRQCQRIRDECGRCAWGTCTDGLAEAHFHLASWAKRQKGKLDNPLTALDHVLRKAADDVIRAVADETL